MSTIAKLKFVASKAGSDVSLATIRQRKMVAALKQQILLVRAQVEGSEYTATTRAWVTNDLTGARERIQWAKRIKAW